MRGRPDLVGQKGLSNYASAGLYRGWMHLHSIQVAQRAFRYFGEVDESMLCAMIRARTGCTREVARGLIADLAKRGVVVPDHSQRLRPGPKLNGGPCGGLP